MTAHRIPIALLVLAILPAAALLSACGGESAEPGSAQSSSASSGAKPGAPSATFDSSFGNAAIVSPGVAQASIKWSNKSGAAAAPLCKIVLSSPTGVFQGEQEEPFAPTNAHAAAWSKVPVFLVDRSGTAISVHGSELSCVPLPGKEVTAKPGPNGKFAGSIRYLQKTGRSGLNVAMNVANRATVTGAATCQLRLSSPGNTYSQVLILRTKPIAANQTVSGVFPIALAKGAASSAWFASASSGISCR